MFSFLCASSDLAIAVPSDSGLSFSRLIFFRQDLHPLTPAERMQLAGIGREMFVESVAGAGRAPVTPRERSGVDAVLDNWHLGADGSIHHNGGVTSKVTAVTGRVVTTAAHGSRYRLERIKPEVAAVLARLSIVFDPETPLSNPASLVYAWTIHSLTAEMQECRARVQGLEGKLSTFGQSVKDCFATIDKAFLALGFPVP